MQFVLMILAAIAPAESKDPDQTKRVIDLLADYQINHDELFKGGFAFVGKGVEVSEKTNKMYLADRWYLCVYEGPRRRLDASGAARSNNLGKYSESWMQYLEYDNKQLFRPSMRHDTTVDTSTEKWKEEEKEKQTLHHLAVPQPLRNLLTSPIGYTKWTNPHDRSGSEFLISNDAELVEGKYTKDGDIEATFRLKSNFPTSLTIKFGKRQKYFPVETLMKVQLHGKWKPVSFTEVTWEHRAKYSVPVKVKFTEFALTKGSPTRQLDVDFDWKTGKQVTKSIDPKLTDWREPFREMFDVDWQ